ncbi:zinc finger protein CKR1-like isoform X2 [Apteryx mantelli]|uniref:Zinc finger protein CKR1-like isoform X2 n=1 Tax=Apteryx mantelli TaxID=2696672 RepID=A0ABM4FYD3_9AVES
MEPGVMLESRQKALYRDVMQESYETLMSLAHGLMYGKEEEDEEEAAAEESRKEPKPRAWESPEREKSPAAGSNGWKAEGADEAAMPKPTSGPGGATGMETERRRGRVRERPFGCSDCGKRFPWASHLERHRRTHTGERPFGCPECGRSYSQGSHLAKHRRSHGGGQSRRPPGRLSHGCGICGKRFPWASHLERHWRAHTGEKPYECPECGGSFSQGSHLAKHRRGHRAVPGATGAEP